MKKRITAINPQEAEQAAEKAFVRYAGPPKGTRDEKAFPARTNRGYPGECAMPNVVWAVDNSAESPAVIPGAIKLRFMQKTRSPAEAPKAREPLVSKPCLGLIFLPSLSARG